MDNLDFQFRNGSIELQGIPDGMKLIEIDHPQARRVADLSLHIADLKFARACLDAVNKPHSNIVSDALWRAAIIYFAKCFGDGARFLLQPGQVYKNKPSAAVESFN